MRIASQEVARAAVLGYGRTGRAAVRFLLAHEVEPFVSDAACLSTEDLASLKERGIRYETGGHTERALACADLVVMSPGVPPSLSLLGEARGRGILVLSELDLAYLVRPERPIVAVTGTKGKGTTVELIAALLRHVGVRAVVAGNIGTPAISVVEESPPPDVFLLEVSSFQLEQSELFHPQVAVLVNLTPDHLDRHSTMAAYVAAKARLFRHLTEEETAVLPSDLVGLFSTIRARRVLFDCLPLPPLPFAERLAAHNRENLKAAIAASSAFLPRFDPSAIRFEDIEGALSLPFRLQEEGTIDGIRIVNDSKSTNAASTIAALSSFASPVVLLLGGRHKLGGYERLAREVAIRSVRQVVLFGEAARFLEETLTKEGYARVRTCVDLAEALEEGLAASLPKDVLLFSPACASFDQYTDAHARGEEFSRLVRAHASLTPPVPNR